MSRCFSLSAFLLIAPMFCVAQVQVSAEPRHRNVFENAWVRVLDVHIAPGDTSLIHKHSTPSVFLVLSKTRTGSQVITEPHDIQLHDGNIWFEGFYGQPRIHRVWNSDTTDFHVIDMELLNKNPKPIGRPLTLNSISPLFDEKAVRGYRFTLPAHSTLKLPQRIAPMVVIGLTDTEANVVANQKTFSKKGDFVFLEPGTTVDFVNSGNPSYSFAVFELK